MTYRITLFSLSYPRSGGYTKKQVGRTYFSDLSRPDDISDIGRQARLKLKATDATDFDCECMESTYAAYSRADLMELRVLQSLPTPGRWQPTISGTI